MIERKLLSPFHYFGVTECFLRPTESLTLFLQQLGRGLRLTESKEALEDAITWVLEDDLIYAELTDLLSYQYERIDFLDKPLEDIGFECPLDLYCAYTLDQILAALGKHTEQKKSHFQEGVLYLPEKKLDVFL